MKQVKNERGFILVGAAIALALIPTALLVSMQATDALTKTSRFFQTAKTRNQMVALSEFLFADSKNPDSDAYFELRKPDPGNAIPLAVLGSVPNDEFGTPFRYYAWDLGAPNAADANYSQTVLPFADPNPDPNKIIGRILSAGKDKTFQTGATDATALGDDIVLEIRNSDARRSQAAVGGWLDEGPSIRTLNPADNIGLGVSAPTHRLELASGTTAAEGAAFGDTELYRGAANTLTLGTGDSLDLASGNFSIGGTTIFDSSRNATVNNLTVSSGLVTLAGATTNTLVMPATLGGLGAPTAIARSPGTKVVLWPSVDATHADYGFGMESGALWASVSDTTQAFKWYGGTTQAMALTGAGNLTVVDDVTVSGGTNALSLKPGTADHVYMELYARTADPGIRSAWFGYGSAGATALTLANSINGGDISLATTGTGKVTTNGNLSLGADLQMNGTAVLNSSRQLLNIAGLGTSLVPTATDTFDLGSALFQYNNIYTKNLYVNGGSVLGGSGNAGYIPKFTAANTLGNSLITDIGTGIQVAGTMKGYSLQLSDLNAIISSDTLDASDTKRLQLAGGGTVGTTRGAYINVHGNEHATYPGVASILAGNPVGYVNIFTNWGELARFNESGRILFGTTTDDAANRLQVYGTVMSKSVDNASSGRFTAHNEDATSSVIATTYGSAYVGNVLGVPAANWGMFVANGANSNGLVVGTYTAKPLVFGTNNAEVGRFTSDGKLLLGTTTNDGTSVLQANGNLALIGTGRRILADFSNDAALNNRAAFQSSVTNGATIVNAIPNGTGGSSIWRAFNTTDMDNSSYVQMMVNATTAQILSGNVGTGTALPLSFVVGGAERFRLNTNGTIYTPGLTASRVVFTDASQNLTSTGTVGVGQGGTGVTGTPTNGQLLIGNGTGYTIAGLTGTADQVVVTNGAGSITLSLPQSIATTSTPTFAGLTLNGTAVQLSLTNATSNMILFGAGSAAPAYTTRSAGTKIILSSALTGTTADYALGIEANALWSSVPSSSQAFKWYAGTSQIASLTGDGRLGLGTQAACDAILQVLGHGGIPYYSPTSWYAGQKMGQGTALYWAKDAGSYTYSLGQSGDTFYFGKSTTEASGAGGSTDYMMRLDGDGRTFINRLHGGGISGAVRISTLTGYVDIGSTNAGYTHIQTDRPAFYMNKLLYVDGALHGYSGATTVYGSLTIGGDKNGYTGAAFTTAAGTYTGNLMISADRRHWGLYDQNVGWKMWIDATARTVEFRGDGNAAAVLTTPATYAP